MTTSKRRQALPKSHSTPRNNLETSLIHIVDDCLKSLRKTSRRLPPTVASYSSETQILERVLYKSRNQHGRTLFYRNLVEIKRLANRIEETSLSSLLETIRSSFYSKEVANSNAWKTAPWSHIPSNGFFDSVLKRLNEVLILHEKATEAYEKASIAFSRFSHSTAFLPLSITVLGIAARLCALTIELSHVSKAIWVDIHRLLVEAEPSHKACKCKVAPCFKLYDAMPDFVDAPPLGAIGIPDPELGEMIARPEAMAPYIDTEAQILEAAVLQTEADLQEAEETITFQVTAPIIRSVKMEKLSSGADTASSGAVKPASSPPPRKRKKKTRPVDEIDDIFG